MQSTEMPANLRFVNSNALFSNSIDRQFSDSLPHSASITTAQKLLLNFVFVCTSQIENLGICKIAVWEHSNRIVILINDIDACT